MKQLNLGCGADIRADFVNMDRNRHPGVDVEHDLNAIPWPFPDGTFDHIYASHVLEHVVDFAQVWSEIGRVLKVGGTIEVRVPYKVNYDPYHIRYFSLDSIERLTVQSHPNAPEHAMLDDGVAKFQYVSHEIHRFRIWQPPWYRPSHWWHVYLPFSRKLAELRFVLRKVA